MRTSENINEIAKALALAQGAMKPAVFDSENTYFKKGNGASKYASLKSCMDCIREPFSSNGLSVVQNVISQNNMIGITTILFHASGQFIEYDTCFFNPKDQTIQGYGGAITYGKRYCLCSALSIVADDDDDGNSATFISKEEAEILLLYLELCGAEVKNRFIAHINKVYYAKGDFCKIPSNAYQDLKLGLVKERTKTGQEATATT